MFLLEDVPNGLWPRARFCRFLASVLKPSFLIREIALLDHFLVQGPQIFFRVSVGSKMHFGGKKQVPQTPPNYYEEYLGSVVANFRGG